MIEFKITGIKEIRRAFKRLPAIVARKVIKKAIRESLRPIKAEVERLAPKRSGLLAQSVKIRAAKQKRGAIRIRVQIGAGDFKGKTYYAAFVEYGTKNKKGLPKIEGRHYMKQAYELHKDSARKECIQRIRRGVDEAVKQLRRS